MTLIIARISQNFLRIDSDSKITDPLVASNRNNIFSSLLKTIILNPTISVSYAGGVETAQKAIEELYKLNDFNINVVKAELLKVNIDSQYETDFLIASLENRPLLYKISNGEINVSDQSQWIGDIDGFNLFQKNFIPNVKSTDGLHILSVQNAAFKEVISCGSIESIGGFHVSVHSTTKGLEYEFKMTMSLGSMNVQLKSNEVFHLLGGNVENGSFATSYLISENPFNAAIAIHFPFGNFGTLYYPKLTREVILIKNANPLEFVDIVLKQYKIKLTGMLKNGNCVTYI